MGQDLFLVFGIRRQDVMPQCKSSTKNLETAVLGSIVVKLSSDHANLLSIRSSGKLSRLMIHYFRCVCVCVESSGKRRDESGDAGRSGREFLPAKARLEAAQRCPITAVPFLKRQTAGLSAQAIVKWVTTSTDE